jgi:hypothetical protein
VVCDQTSRVEERTALPRLQHAQVSPTPHNTVTPSLGFWIFYDVSKMFDTSTQCADSKQSKNAKRAVLHFDQQTGHPNGKETRTADGAPHYRTLNAFMLLLSAA